MLVETTPRDDNNIPALMAVLNTDTVQGEHLVVLGISSGGFIKINRTSTIAFTMIPVDPKDENYANCWLFEGSDGKTYPAVADADGALLVAL